MIAALIALLACASPAGGASVAPAAPQGEADAARERLAALIESTNALAGFHAVYVLTRDDEELGRVELTYAAPDRLLMSNHSEQGWARVGIGDGRLWMESESSGAGKLSGAFELDDHGGTFEEALQALAEGFPRPADQIDVSVRFQWGVNPSSDKTEFDLSLAYVRSGEMRVLGWLQTLKRMQGELTLEGESLVHVSPRVRAEVDCATGFLSRLHMTGAEGEERVLTLLELDLEGPFADDLFTRSEPAEDARDISTELRAQMFSPAALRSDCLMQIDDALFEGRAWDESTRGHARRFLEALHRPVLVGNVERWKSSVLAGIDEFAAELSERRAAGVDESELQAVIDERRASLVEGTAGTLARLRESLASATRNPRPSEHWVDLRSLEDEVLGELYRDEVEAPLLAAFDERT